MPLTTALQVAQAITANNAGRPMNRILLAEAMDLSPTSSGFRDRVMASYRYGLTEGNYTSQSLSLTPTGVAASRPRNSDEGVAAQRKAFAHVPVFNQLLAHFSNARVPESKFLTNTLVREPFSIDPAWAAEVADIFLTNARDVGYLRMMSGAPWLVTDAGTAAMPDSPVEDGGPQPDDVVDPDFEEAIPVAAAAPPTAPTRSKAKTAPVQVFIAHGSNRKPVDQLKKILNEWQVPFVVAVDEPHAGRPISEKVADLMRSCSAGIFIFTADEEFSDDAGNKVYRPSQNVVYELGAAGLLYGRKIVIFKETQVSFPSDFRDLGWIDFDRDALDAKAMDLLRELIALKAVRLVSSTSE